MDEKLMNQNLKSRPQPIKMDYRVNQKGQLIVANHQILDQRGHVIDNDCRVVGRSQSKSKSPAKVRLRSNSSRGSSRRIININIDQSKMKK